MSDYRTKLEPADLRDHITQLAARAVLYEALRAYAGKLADEEWKTRGEVTRGLLAYGVCEDAAAQAASNCRAVLRALTPQYLRGVVQSLQ